MLPKGMEMAAELRYLPPRRLMLASAAPAASIGDNGMQMNHEPFGTEAKFDTNMVIILAALLCALVCALGLNSIVRCALRCGGRFPFETPEETAARLASTGLKKSALRRIPIAVFGTATEILATECPICLGEFTQGDKVRLLPKCHHGFHVSCIDTWLLSHSSCPTCRTSLLEHTPPSHSGGANANANANANPPPSV